MTQSTVLSLSTLSSEAALPRFVGQVPYIASQVVDVAHLVHVEGSLSRSGRSCALLGRQQPVDTQMLLVLGQPLFMPDSELVCDGREKLRQTHLIKLSMH